MDAGNKITNILKFLGVIWLQIIMTQVVTFLFSLIAPGMGDYPQAYPVIFVAILGVSFTIGVFLIGWLALIRKWLVLKPLYLARLVGALIGAYIPLITALFLYHPLEPGNPFFFISILTCILGFYLPGFLRYELHHF